MNKEELKNSLKEADKVLAKYDEDLKATRELNCALDTELQEMAKKALCASIERDEYYARITDLEMELKSLEDDRDEYKQAYERTFDILENVSYGINKRQS